MLANIFAPENLIIVIVVVAVLFGGARIPKLARSLGSAKSEFEAGIREGAKATEESKLSPEGDDSTKS